MKRILTALSLFLAAAHLNAAVINLSPDVDNASNPLVGLAQWTIDLGFVADSSNKTLFDSWSDGKGIALVQIGNDLVVYQEEDDFEAFSPVGNTLFSVGIGIQSGGAFNFGFGNVGMNETAEEEAPYIAHFSDDLEREDGANVLGEVLYVHEAPAGTIPNPDSIPEPSSSLLLLFGAMGFFRRQR